VTARAPLSDQPCQNCGDPTEGNYCRVCGQHKIDHSTSLRALVADTVEDLSLTSELPRTLKALFLKPGFLTLEYSAGRIARYIPPLRLYLAASLLFFLTLSFIVRSNNPVGQAAAAADSAAVAGAQKTAPGARPVAITIDSADRRHSMGIQRSKTQKSGMHINTPSATLNKRLETASARLNALPPGEANRRIRDFMIQRGPMIVFLLLPLVALLLKVFFWGSRRHYTEHFVFALHTHALIYLVFTILLLFPKNGSMKYPALALMYGMVFYVLLAMKRVYQQGWIRTVLKWLMLTGIYFTVAITALIIEAIAAVLMV
jgi:hypothetical protein